MGLFYHRSRKIAIEAGFSPKKRKTLQERISCANIVKAAFVRLGAISTEKIFLGVNQHNGTHRNCRPAPRRGGLQRKNHGLSAIITASAATIGYFVGPYVARAWSTSVSSTHLSAYSNPTTYCPIFPTRTISKPLCNIISKKPTIYSPNNRHRPLKRSCLLYTSQQNVTLRPPPSGATATSKRSKC